MKQMFFCENTEEYVFKQGDQASSYFIINEGEVQIEINDQFVRKLNKGEGFGELALLYNAPRSASIKCIGKCTFWGINRNTFRKTVEEMVQKNYESNRNFMEQVNFFRQLNNEQKNSIASRLITTKYEKNEYIFNQGDNADSFFMIKEGIVSIWLGNKEIRKLGKGDSFREQALYLSGKRAASVLAEEQVYLLSLGRENLTKILGDKIQIIIFNNIVRWSFAKSQLLKQLTHIQIEKITNNCKITNYQQGQIIYSKGQVCDQLIIVLEGSLINSKGKQIATKGQLYGDIFLKEQNQNIAFEYDIFMVLSVIQFNNLKKFIGGEIENVIKLNEYSHEKQMSELQQKKDFSHILIENLIYIKKLGQGQFGHVYLVQNKDNLDLYALKQIQKSQIVEQTLENHIIQEKQVLENTNFRFIMQFLRTYKDNNNIYFLVQFICGMELFDVIRDIQLLSTYDSQFYIGTLILCLEYLHSRNIIYRDLKPENIMVDQNGIMYLIDLGTAKILKQQNSRTFSIIGTPHYMAPEIIVGKGYSFSVDLWSLGICLYEFLCGGLPFAEDLDDAYEIYEEIIKNNLIFPPEIKDRNAKRIIEQLLSQFPELRLGGSYAALKAHPWFDTISWDDLYNMKLQPPYIPPKDRIVNLNEINNLASKGKMVMAEIKKEIKSNQKQLFTKIPGWDQNF
ncbi:protein kinase domain protein [Ichthyophthirius multifiliis]|uniref:cGMP-dependent protein kinase n=1 Tax=Ichthyophthirius multifiliis TaxID=5932 RepID=G0QZP4_ICHMU|nr:protein kinase domain protein [Ichthyophthirius multifiliis]EGR29318.1 protein kinase domain protein [Ichthyophthirius multifiliis]|eukprot:XP_004030554.1 protein kinase domain protein [Ichthyophthirius multifiliis]